MDISQYQREQLETLRQVRTFLDRMSPSDACRLHESVIAYRTFRDQTDCFLQNHFSGICSANCYQSHLSACCSKEGIITFFADVVMNALFSDRVLLDRLSEKLLFPNTGYKCIYLDESGCLWNIKPIVCQMFLCDKAEEAVFTENPAAGDEWADLKRRQKIFTWPDRRVLFDDIETIFLEAGFISPLMYLHNSPGLINVKRRAGLPTS